MDLLTLAHTSNDSRAPRVTVLMSVYNGARYLRAAVDSILGQTFTDFEFIIVEDGSTDDSLKILRSYADRRIKVLTNERNLGLTKSLNRGLRLARGEFVARQDADDISLPRRLEKQVEHLDHHPEVLVLGTQAIHIDANGRVFRAPGWEYSVDERCIRWICMFESPFLHTSVMMRRRPLVELYGGYNETYITSQDFELWSRVVFGSVCRNLDEKLVYFRSHKGSVSANYTLSKVEAVREIFSNAARSALGEEPPSGWTDLWLTIGNLGLYRVKPDVRRIGVLIDQMHDRFVRRHGIQSFDPELAYHRDRILTRVAFVATRFDRLGSLSILCRVGARSFGLVLMLLPKYFILLLLGNALRRRSGAASAAA